MFDNGDRDEGALLVAALSTHGRAEAAACAAKLAIAAELHRLRQVEQRGAVVQLANPAAIEVAVAWQVSTGAATSLIHLGQDLRDRLPGLGQAFARGEVSFLTVRAVAERLTEVSDPAVLAEVEEGVLVRLLDRRQCTTTGQLHRLVDRLLATLDPESVRRRRERAVSDRDVTVRAEADGMAGLYGLLPGPDGVVVDQRLRTMSRQVCTNDPRTLSQRRSDALTALARGTVFGCECGGQTCTADPDTDWIDDDQLDDVTTEDGAAGDGVASAEDRNTAEDAAGAGLEAPADAGAAGEPASDGQVSESDGAAAGRSAGAPAGRRHRCKPEFHVVVNAETLLGVSELPGMLAGMGVIDPDTVRRLAADATWRRLLTIDGDPVELGRRCKPGEVPDAAALRYEPPPRLAALVRSRDGHCRFPGCTVPAAGCDLDHRRPFNHSNPTAGGWTVEHNLQALCRRHHRAKTRSDWTSTPGPRNTIHWTGPAGQHLTTHPDGLPPPETEAPTDDAAMTVVNIARPQAPAALDDEPPPF